VDIFAEVPQKDKFQNLLDEIQPMREEIYQDIEITETITTPPITLSLQKIIG